MSERETLRVANDAALPPLLANDQRKLSALRAEITQMVPAATSPVSVPLPPYEA